MLGLARGTVVVVAHDDAWAEAARQCIARLKAILGDDAVDIRHVGSTAIRGIPAKPIIDIAVAVRDFQDILRHRDDLAAQGILYRGQEHGEQLLYVCGDFAADTRTHHIHVVLQGSEAWRNYLNFRDYMNCHEGDAKAYAALKEALARQYADDRGAYTTGKQAFIDSILRKAAAWRETALPSPSDED